MISAKAARSSGGASWLTQPPEKEMTSAGSSPAFLKNCGLARSMISRTGDLVHLNALTFFEIFGFMQNKNGFAMAKPHQGIKFRPHGNATAVLFGVPPLGGNRQDLLCRPPKGGTPNRPHQVSQTRDQHATEPGDDAETFGRHGHAIRRPQTFRAGIDPGATAKLPSLGNAVIRILNPFGSIAGEVV